MTIKALLKEFLGSEDFRRFRKLAKLRAARLAELKAAIAAFLRGDESLQGFCAAISRAVEEHVTLDGQARPLWGFGGPGTSQFLARLVEVADPERLEAELRRGLAGIDVRDPSDRLRIFAAFVARTAKEAGLGPESNLHVGYATCFLSFCWHVLYDLEVPVFYGASHKGVKALLAAAAVEDQEYASRDLAVRFRAFLRIARGLRDLLMRASPQLNYWTVEAFLEWYAFQADAVAAAAPEFLSQRVSSGAPAGAEALRGTEAVLGTESVATLSPFFAHEPAPAGAPAAPASAEAPPPAQAAPGAPSVAPAAPSVTPPEAVQPPGQVAARPEVPEPSAGPGATLILSTPVFAPPPTVVPPARLPAPAPAPVAPGEALGIEPIPERPWYTEGIAAPGEAPPAPSVEPVLDVSTLAEVPLKPVEPVRLGKLGTPTEPAGPGAPRPGVAAEEPGAAPAPGPEAPPGMVAAPPAPQAAVPAKVAAVPAAAAGFEAAVSEAPVAAPIGPIAPAGAASGTTTEAAAAAVVEARRPAWTISSEELAALAAETLFPEGLLRELDALLSERGQVLIEGPTGTGKTHLARRFAAAFAGSPSRVRTVQFHPAFCYEDFVESPAVSGAPARAGLFRVFARAAASDPANRFVLILDDIGRADIVAVLGECFSLLEYRGEEVILPHSGESFSIPKNLYLVATAGADPFGVLADPAFRRRFRSVRLEPDPEMLSRYLESRSPSRRWLADLLAALNRRIAVDAGSRFLIGQSLFMRPDLDDAQLQRIWRAEVQPLIAAAVRDSAKLAEYELEAFRKRIEASSADRVAAQA